MMWTNSNELLEHALRELHKAMENNKQEVVILLKNAFIGDDAKMREVGEQLEIRAITGKIREKFSNYEIKSTIGLKGNFSCAVSFGNMGKIESCVFAYPLEWHLTLRKKA